MNAVVVRIIKISLAVIGFILVAGIAGYLTLTLLVKGQDAVIVPDLSGKEVVQVLEILSDLGLNTKVRQLEYNDATPKNHVISQDPQAGAQIKPGRDVRIVISKGPRRIVMSNIIGLSIQQAQIILEQNDLSRRTVSKTSSMKLEKDRIIAQYPLPGQMVNRNEGVDLLVSDGPIPRSMMMPELSGLPLEEAILLIERSRLRLGEVSFQHSEDLPGNAVVSQTPLSGYRVTEKQGVDLMVNRKTGASQTAAENLTGVFLFQYRLPEGFLNRRMQLRLHVYGFSTDLIDDFFKPAEQIGVLIPRDADASVFVYEDDNLIQSIFFQAGQCLPILKPETHQP